MTPTGHYQMPAHCSNCGHRWNELIPRGHERPDGPIECGVCGCRTATVANHAWREKTPPIAPNPFGPYRNPYAPTVTCGGASAPHDPTIQAFNSRGAH